MDRRRVRIDLRGEAAIPGDDDAALLVDLVDDAAIAGTQAGVVPRILDELDPRSNSHAGPQPGGEKPCALGIHTTHIGFGGREL